MEGETTPELRSNTGALSACVSQPDNLILEENNRVMNNFKFIGRYLALVAAFAGVSTQASAQVCGVHPGCDDPGDLQFTQSFSDTTGVVEVPLVAGLYTLSAGQFNPAERAAFHGVNVGDITLKQVDINFTLRPDSYDSFCQNLSVVNPCEFKVQYPVAGQFLANAGLGTSAVSHNYDFGWESAVAIGATVSKSLADFIPPQPAFKTECQAIAAGLGGYVGAGNVSWDLTLLGALSLTGTTCNQNINGTTSFAEARLDLTYYYCVEENIVIEGGCVCDQGIDYRRPGSLLLFPEFDARQGMYTLITVTNTDCMYSDGGATSDGGDVDVHFVYYREDDCQEVVDTRETLTSCDTLTLLAGEHVPGNDRGFMVAYAVDGDNGTRNHPLGVPISWDHLIGNVAVIDGMFSSYDYSVNAVSFRSGSGYVDRENIDPGDTGSLSMDGTMYFPAPNIITIPRFFGQDDADPPFGNEPDLNGFNSELILIGLTGKGFLTDIYIEFWNDDEAPLSKDYQFTCWEKVYLQEISSNFENDFLQTTLHTEPPAVIHMQIDADDRETGWMCIYGVNASKNGIDIPDPAIYAVLVEHYAHFGVADLPWECGVNLKGKIW
jgi:hypothetical protein